MQAGGTITRGTMGWVRFVRGQSMFEETRDSIFVRLLLRGISASVNRYLPFIQCDQYVFGQ
jgi:hypothetical protein